MESKDLKAIFSSNLKKFRGIRGLKQTELAEQSGLSNQTIIRMEGGNLWPSEKTLCKISETLNIEPYKFFVPNEPSNMINSDSTFFQNNMEKYIKEIIKMSYEEFMNEKKKEAGNNK